MSRMLAIAAGLGRDPALHSGSAIEMRRYPCDILRRRRACTRTNDVATVPSDGAGSRINRELESQQQPNAKWSLMALSMQLL
jgi:hypothetical protein